MSKPYWIGTLPSGVTAISQVDTLTVGGTIEAGDKFKVTMTGEDGSTVTLSVLSTTTVIATTCTDIATAFNASVDPLFTPVTAVAGATTVTLTADTAGVPFYCTVTTTEGDNSASDGQTFARAATTANRGSSDYNTAYNWSTQAVPVASDDVIIDQRMTAAILYGLDQSGVALTSFRRYVSDKAVGTSTAPLKIQSADIQINIPTTDGSSVTPAFTAIDAGTATNATMQVWSGDNTGSGGVANVSINGNKSGHNLYVYGNAVVDVCNMKPSDTGNIPVISARGNSKVLLGAGLSAVTTVTTRDNASVTQRCSVGTVDANGSGTYKLELAAVISTLASIDCKAINNSTGTIANLQLETHAKWDDTQTDNVRIYTQVDLYGDATMKTTRLNTFTAGIDLNDGAKVSNLDFGDGVRITLAAAS